MRAWLVSFKEVCANICIIDAQLRVSIKIGLTWTEPNLKNLFWIQFGYGWSFQLSSKLKNDWVVFLFEFNPKRLINPIELSKQIKKKNPKKLKLTLTKIFDRGLLVFFSSSSSRSPLMPFMEIQQLQTRFSRSHVWEIFLLIGLFVSFACMPAEYSGRGFFRA